MKPDIITIGNVNLDIIMGVQAPWPVAGTEVVLENCELREGGSAGNAALALEALGCNHQLIANMGQDFMGEWLRERFGRLSHGWTASPLPTTFSVGITHPGGERTFFSNAGHLSGFCAKDVTPHLAPDKIKDSVLLFAGGFLSPLLANAYGELFARLRGVGARIALDTGWPSAGWTADVRDQVCGWLSDVDELLFNEVEICGLAGCAEDEVEGAARHLLGAMPDGANVIVKCGPLGALALTAGGERHEVPARPVAVIDTIGAGDCFNAGYLSARVSGQSIAEAVHSGVQVATTAISTSPRRYCATNP
jgi:sugar/nucleoside kinase (ribokinase family)